MTEFKFEIMVYSVPKSGTHLVSDILALIYEPKCNIYSKIDMYNIIYHQINCNFLDKIKTKGISTHPCYIPYDVVKGINVKKIFVIRHPLDIAISRYYYNEERRNINKRRPIDKYINDTLPKVINQITTHIDEYNKNTNSLLLTFENINLKKSQTIKQISNFMNFKLNPDNLKNIIEKTTFEKVHNHEKKSSYIVGKKQPNMFHRSGKSKQWETELTPEQYNKFLNIIPEKLKVLFN